MSAKVKKVIENLKSTMTQREVIVELLLNNDEESPIMGEMMGQQKQNAQQTQAALIEADLGQSGNKQELELFEIASNELTVYEGIEREYSKFQQNSINFDNLKEVVMTAIFSVKLEDTSALDKLEKEILAQPRQQNNNPANPPPQPQPQPQANNNQQPQNNQNSQQAQRDKEKRDKERREKQKRKEQQEKEQRDILAQIQQQQEEELKRQEEEQRKSRGRMLNQEEYQPEQQIVEDKINNDQDKERKRRLNKEKKLKERAEQRKLQQRQDEELKRQQESDLKRQQKKDQDRVNNQQQKTKQKPRSDQVEDEDQREINRLIREQIELDKLLQQEQQDEEDYSRLDKYTQPTLGNRQSAQDSYYQSQLSKVQNQLRQKELDLQRQRELQKQKDREISQLAAIQKGKLKQRAQRAAYQQREDDLTQLENRTYVKPKTKADEAWGLDQYSDLQNAIRQMKNDLIEHDEIKRRMTKDLNLNNLKWQSVVEQNEQSYGINKKQEAVNLRLQEDLMKAKHEYDEMKEQEREVDNLIQQQDDKLKQIEIQNSKENIDLQERREVSKLEGKLVELKYQLEEIGTQHQRILKEWKDSIQKDNQIQEPSSSSKSSITGLKLGFLSKPNTGVTSQSNLGNYSSRSANKDLLRKGVQLQNYSQKFLNNTSQNRDKIQLEEKLKNQNDFYVTAMSSRKLSNTGKESFNLYGGNKGLDRSMNSASFNSQREQPDVNLYKSSRVDNPFKGSAFNYQSSNSGFQNPSQISGRQDNKFSNSFTTFQGQRSSNY